MSEKPSKGLIWTGRVLSALPVLLMLFSGTMKLTKGPGVVEGFQKFGYSEHLLLTIGLLEVGCVIIYLIPQTAVLGAILMTGYLGGATATHVRAGDPAWYGAVICGVLVWLGLLLRERRLWPLLPFRKE
jgi:hypothetical protein